MPESNGYQHLESRTGRFRQLFVKGQAFTAERLYRETVGEDPRTPEQVAYDFEVPLEAVLEAIEYCEENDELLRREREEELERIRPYEEKYPPLRPPAGLPDA